MKNKYKVVFTHMNTTHWEVEAYDKDEATRKGLELSENFKWSHKDMQYLHPDATKELITVPDIQLLSVEEQVK
tara:strand:- start:2993 stop:3211 length:219 start_codon:yes stop_codon:yes gene_type:complete